MKILRRHFSSIPSDVLQISRNIVNLTNFPFSVNFPDTFYKDSCKGTISHSQGYLGNLDTQISYGTKTNSTPLEYTRVFGINFNGQIYRVNRAQLSVSVRIACARVQERVLLAKFRGSRHGSYYRVIETRTNGFRTDSQWRRRPSSSFEDPESTFPSPPLQRNEPR